MATMRITNRNGWHLNGVLQAALVAAYPMLAMQQVLSTSLQLAMGEGVRDRTPHTLSHFDVAGVNLGPYGQYAAAEGNRTEANQDASPFELFEDFNIESMVRGDEKWEDLLEYRRLLERPSLSFYVDKVARKRWMPSIGIAQPRSFALSYGSELGACKNLEHEQEVILSHLPAGADYAAKPSHHADGSGLWLVSPGVDNMITSVTASAEKLEKVRGFDQEEVAKSLAENLYENTPFVQSWALRKVKPGIVIEERFTALEGHDLPPLEFQMFTIWGRVWLAQINVVGDEGRFNEGFVYRDGSMAEGSYHKTFPFDWVNWKQLVDSAERLGANKDMFRTDIFVGVPAGWSKPGATEEERLTAVEYVVSESEIYPTTYFDPLLEMAEEGARLWVAGYKLGNYRTVPNTEVPQKFLDYGAMPLEDYFPVCHYTKDWDATHQTLTHFDVAGVNLALYGLSGEGCEMEEQASQDAEPFELYDTFNIEDQIRGDEDWADLKNYRRNMMRSQTIYYEDKVTMKRWLSSLGISIPPLFALKYASELSESGTLEDDQAAIFSLLPKNNHYVAKPTHKAESYDVWIVRNNTNDGTMRVSKDVGEFQEHDDFDHQVVADSLAKALHERPDDWESWSLLHVKPGIVVESLISSWDKGNTEWDTGDEPAALEFKFLVIWGRVWVAQMFQGGNWHGVFNPGYAHRNGTMVKGSVRESIPDWLDWPQMVDIAERVGAHKDMLRVDIFPGVEAGATMEEKREAVKYYVSEVELKPDTELSEELMKEGARLWVAGYKMGNYRVVPNYEFPAEYDYGTSSLPVPDGVDEYRNYELPPIKLYP